MLPKPILVPPPRTNPERATTAAAWLDLHARADNAVKIYIARNCPSASDRIELSNGTLLADTSKTAALDRGIAYEEGARLPREPWRRPTPEEAESLIATELPRDTARSVAVVRLPCEFSDGLRETIKNTSTESIEADLLQPLRTVCTLDEPLHFVGVNANAANLMTVTVNHAVGRYNGLHVDSWDQLDINSRHLATNRICINIGKGDRYFMFLPLSLMDIAAVLREKLGPRWQIPPRYTLVGRQFMETFPDVPAIRCRLAPGEAYIAPTENLVHDGSSLGQTEIDEQFTIRGHIRPL